MKLRAIDRERERERTTNNNNNNKGDMLWDSEFKKEKRVEKGAVI